MQYSEISTGVDREDQFDMRKKRVVTGPLVVTRNPCLHPGDVRQLEAVDFLELSHLVDCVVFPRCGARPHCNEMAGRDCGSKVVAGMWGRGCFFFLKNGSSSIFRYSSLEYFFILRQCV